MLGIQDNELKRIDYTYYSTQFSAVGRKENRK